MKKNKREAVIIFGAGKTGRGFIGHLCSASDKDIVFVDKDEELIARLKQKQTYQINMLNKEKVNIEINPRHYFSIDDPSWMDVFASAKICFTAVFGNNLEDLAGPIAKGIEYRIENGNDDPMNIITCENLSHSASVLRKHVVDRMHDPVSVQYLDAKVGFVESIILKTCLSDPDHPLNLIAQDFNDLPCDRDAFKGNIPEITGLKPMLDFQNQLIRKIYTYNCINALITYMGAARGYKYLFEASRDPEIYPIAVNAGLEASKALVAEFDFDPEEQEAWVRGALNKFSDAGIPDTIFRNGADPRRKLGREDRLIGPANLALKHHFIPHAIIRGILAALEYEDEAFSMKSAVALMGIEWILQQYCNLDPGEPLFQIIKQYYQQSRNVN